MSSDEIRTAYVEFWQERGSQLQPSASLIPHRDPTVLFTIAGMQPFVPYFLGREPAPAARLVSIQKCFRTNDIDEVGDPRHLTFFEMMGNFSVGDYFKSEVIPWAYEFVTQKLRLESERLWITVHETDDEAESLWRAAGIPVSRIVRLGDEDNWWGPPGTSGPCGPDSEIYYQQEPGHGCGFPHDPPDCDCGRLEFWNLVFMQYFQDEAGERTPLPRKNVDTGIGLERSTALSQRTASVYETDLFMPIIRETARLAGRAYGESTEVDYALRVLADHGRGMTFLVADGVVPGSGGREYVLRRIVRRATRYGRRLGLEGPFLAELARSVIRRMAPYYSQLERDQPRILQVLTQEEELFTRTLEAGTIRLERLILEARAAGAARIPGATVFDLYQTFGFPRELTEELLREQSIAFDPAEYQKAFETEQARAREGASFHRASKHESDRIPGVPATEFLAWTAVRGQSRILAVQGGGDGASDPTLATGAAGQIVLEASPFYPEGGGQVGDTGYIRCGSAVFRVESTITDASGHILHAGRVEVGAVQVGDLATAEVDIDRRMRATRHHTVTHLLHRALKDVLGEGTSQQGSLVSPELARFDFNYPRQLTPAQLREVSQIINDRAMQNLPVDWEITNMENARRTGAVMMFGEKYGDSVRLVSIGNYSKELCGGTHAHHSGELGMAAIVSEVGIGSGKRRIVAHAGQAALDYFATRSRHLDELVQRLGAQSAEDAPQRVEALLEQADLARREMERFQHARAHEEAQSLVGNARDVAGVKLVAARVDATEEVVKQLIDAVRERLGSGVVALAAVQDGRPRYFVGSTPDLAGRRVHAGHLVRDFAARAGGKAGGRPDFASGGGGDPREVDSAVKAVAGLLESMLARSAP